MSSKLSTDIDIASIWRGVRRSLPVLVIVALIAGATTYAILSLMAPRYEAETQLTITAKSTNPYASSTNDAGAAATVTPRLDPAAINTHVRALMAPDLLLEVARSLRLGERAEFNSALGPVDTIDSLMRFVGMSGPRSGDSTENRVLSTMRKNLTVSSARQSRFIVVKFSATDPQLAADVANAIASAYRRSLREIPVRETNDAVAALEPKIKQLTREVFEAEAKAKRFRAESDQLTGGSTSPTLQQQRLTQLSADLVRAEAERANSEARLSAAQELAVGGGADSLPEVQQSRVFQDLIAQRVRVERQVNEARAVLLPAHPRMIQLNADLSGLRRSIRREVGTIVRSISKEVRLSQLRTDQLRTQIASLKRTVVAKSGDEAKLRSLDTTARSKRNELERLQRQLEDNRTVVDTNRVPVEATVVSTARASDTPVFPRKGFSSLLITLATLMLGIALLVTRELLAGGGPVTHDRRAADKVRPRSRTASGVAAASLAGTTLAGVTAAASGRKQPSSNQPVAGSRPTPNASSTRTKAAAPPAIADYAHHFVKMAPAGGGFRMLIAGAVKHIDPSNEAIDLAAELSDAGSRVLMIDWTLNGHPQLMDIDVGNAASLADLMADQAEFEDILVPLPDTNVHYIYASYGKAIDSLLDEQRLNLILDALDEAYDHVIVFGNHDDARALFEAIEGRFDAGMTIAETAASMPTSSGNFLGFDVAEIEIVHYARNAAPENTTPNPLARPTSRTKRRTGQQAE